MVKRGRAEDLGIRAREGRLQGSRRGQRLLLRESVARKMELTAGPGRRWERGATRLRGERRRQVGLGAGES